MCPGSQFPFRLTPLFHRFQSPDHCFDTRPHLLVFLQKGRAFCGQRVLPLLQRTVFVLKLIANLHQSIYALLKSL